MLSTTLHFGLIAGFSIGRLVSMCLEISDLLFADDTVIFCDNDYEQIINLRCVLIRFEAIYGSRVNLPKSSILPVGEVENAHALAGIWGC